MNAVTKLNPNEIQKLTKTFDKYIASKTSDALSSMFSEPIQHSIKILDEGIIDLQKLKIKNDEITMCGIRLNGKGDTHIEICYTIKIKHAIKIAAKLLCQDEICEIDDMGTSAIQEVANIMTGSFFNAMASATGFRVDLSTPDFAKGQLVPLASVVAHDVIDPIEFAIIADAEFEAQESGFKIHMLIMQDPENARKLINHDSSFAEPSDPKTPSFGGSNEEIDSLFENENNSSYSIGAQNSELDAIVEEALSGGQTP